MLLFFSDLLTKHFRHWRKRLLPTTTILLMKFSKNSFNQKHKNVGKMNSFWGTITKQSSSFRPDLATNLFCQWRKSFLIIFFRHWRKSFSFFQQQKHKFCNNFFSFLDKTFWMKPHNPFFQTCDLRLLKQLNLFLRGRLTTLQTSSDLWTCQFEKASRFSMKSD